MAVESVSAMLSMSSTTQRAGGSAAATASVTSSRNTSALAKNRGPSKRYSTMPGSGSPSGVESAAAVAVGARHAHQERAPRPRGPLGDQQQRQQRDDEDAREHPDRDHDDRGQDRQRRLGAGDRGQAAGTPPGSSSPAATTMMTPARAALGSGCEQAA